MADVSPLGKGLRGIPGVDNEDITAHPRGFPNSNRKDESDDEDNEDDEAVKPHELKSPSNKLSPDRNVECTTSHEYFLGRSDTLSNAVSTAYPSSTSSALVAFSLVQADTSEGLNDTTPQSFNTNSSQRVCNKTEYEANSDMVLTQHSELMSSLYLMEQDHA